MIIHSLQVISEQLEPLNAKLININVPLIHFQQGQVTN